MNGVNSQFARYSTLDVEQEVADYIWGPVVIGFQWGKKNKLDSIPSLYLLAMQCSNMPKYPSSYNFKVLRDASPFALSLIYEPDIVIKEMPIKKAYANEHCVCIQDTAERCLALLSVYYHECKLDELLSIKEKRHGDQFSSDPIFKKYCKAPHKHELMGMIKGVKILAREFRKSRSSNNCAWYAFGNEPWYPSRSKADDVSVHYKTLDFFSKKGWKSIKFQDCEKDDRLIYFDEDPFTNGSPAVALHFAIVDKIKGDKVRVTSKFGGGYIYRHPFEVCNYSSKFVVAIRKIKYSDIFPDGIASRL